VNAKHRLSKAMTLVCLIMILGTAIVPFTPALAAGVNEDQTPPVKEQAVNARLTAIWERLQDIYDQQGRILDRAEKVIDLNQIRLDFAASKGLDTSAVQAALDVFADAVKDAHPIHESGQGIIASHKGFNADGLVTDRPRAIETTQNLAANLKEIRSLVKDPFVLLCQAIRAFREANHPTTAATP